MGVYFDKSRNKWRATFRENGKSKNIGRFDTKLKAVRALNKYRKDQANQIQPHQVPYNWANWTEKEAATIELEQKPSLWDRIKTVWQKVKNQLDN